MVAGGGGVPLKIQTGIFVRIIWQQNEIGTACNKYEIRNTYIQSSGWKTEDPYRTWEIDHKNFAGTRKNAGNTDITGKWSLSSGWKDGDAAVCQKKHLVEVSATFMDLNN